MTENTSFILVYDEITYVVNDKRATYEIERKSAETEPANLDMAPPASPQVSTHVFYSQVTSTNDMLVWRHQVP